MSWQSALPLLLDALLVVCAIVNVVCIVRLRRARREYAESARTARQLIEDLRRARGVGEIRLGAPEPPSYRWEDSRRL